MAQVLSEIIIDISVSKTEHKCIVGYQDSQRINDANVPKGWHRYSISFSDENPFDLAGVKYHARMNHAMDFITKSNLDKLLDANHGYLDIRHIEYRDSATMTIGLEANDHGCTYVFGTKA